MGKDNGGPAFPIPLHPGQSFKGHGGEVDGMTLRDYFAAKAMQAIIAGNGLGFMGRHPSGWDTNAGLTKSAYGIADAMLAERSK